MDGSPFARVRLVLVWLFAIVAVCLGALQPSRQPVAAQESARMSIDQVVISANEDKMTVLVSVVDPTGSPVPNLAHFSVLVDGTVVPVESATPVVDKQAAIAVLLLMDISGSMEGEPLAQARTAATALVRGLLPQDLAALMPFAGSVPDRVDFMSDRASLEAGITSLQVEGGGTALYQAVVRGLSATALAPTTRRAIVLLTDGQESGGTSQYSRDEAIADAATSNIPIFAIGLGDNADSGLLQALSAAAHGNFYRAPAPSDVPTIFNVISAQLRSQYEIVVPVPRATLPSRRVAIETQVERAVLHAEGTFSTRVPAPEPNSGGAPNWIWLAVMAFAVPSIGLAVWRFRGRPRAPKSPLPGGPGADLGMPGRRRSETSPAEAPTGRLTVVEGARAGQHVAVSSTPIHIGTDPSCELRLDDANGAIAACHVRAWVQHDRLIVHHLALGSTTLVAGAAIDWASLEPGQTLQIGPYHVAFSFEQDVDQDVSVFKRHLS